MENESFICVCGKEFKSIRALVGHKASCKEFYLQRDGNLDGYFYYIKRHSKSDEEIKKEKEKLENWISEQHKCEKCGKIMTEYYGSGRFCSRACANSHYFSQKTKEKISKSLSNKVIKNYCADCGKLIRKGSKSGYCRECYFKHRVISEETRHKLSKASISRCAGGFHHNHIKYNGVNLDSSYELIVTKSLDENNIPWIRLKSLKYVDTYNKLHNYIPDFYLPDYDVYLEPKNSYLIENINKRLGFYDLDKLKWASEQNNVKIILLTVNELTWDIIEKKINNKEFI